MTINTDLMAVLQVVIPKGFFYLEFGIEHEYFVAGGDINVVASKRDAAEAPVGTATRKVYFARIPVEDLGCLARLQVDKIDAAVTLALFAAANH